MLSLFILLMLDLLAENGRALEKVPTPSITTEPTSATGLQGGVIIFKCNTLIDRDKTVYLFKGSEMIFQFRSISEPVAFFTLRNLTSKSGGTYRCMSEIFRPRRRKSRPSNAIRLTMRDTQAPLSILRPPSAVVTEGSNVNMTCTANMGNNCVFYAYRGNRYSPIQLGQRRNNTSISILNVTLGDAGKYTCHCLVEVNGIFVFSAPSHFMELTVRESVPKPNITFEPMSGIGLQGGIITVKCEIPSAGEKVVYLLTGSKKISSTVTLSEPAVFFTLANLNSKTPRNYRCMYETLLPKKGKSGPSDEIQLTVLDIQAPSSFLRPTSAKVAEGSNLFLTCMANTKHQCFFYKYSDDEYSPYQSAAARNKTTISMYSIRRSDAGKYVCHCLVEVNGTFSFSAPSNVMELSVIEIVKKTSEKCEGDVSSEYGGLLVVALGVTVFIVLILMSAILATRLSKRRYSPENKEIQKNQ
ncbi:immunoglobulin superfamily member 1-like isoform X1 [Mobula birostris]|uniref:immunoglobulin superfamily member 1-like isoform X1 n=1 Tax=Mobula birostris TaxID=1983395 RepID=UPI003B2846F7